MRAWRGVAGLGVDDQKNTASPGGRRSTGAASWVDWQWLQWLKPRPVASTRPLIPIRLALGLRPCVMVIAQSQKTKSAHGTNSAQQRANSQLLHDSALLH